MGLQRVGRDWVTELNQTMVYSTCLLHVDFKVISLFAIANNAMMNILVYMHFHIVAGLSWGKFLEMGLLIQSVNAYVV